MMISRDVANNLRCAAAILFLICATATTVFGQYDSGNIVGTIRDSSGAVMPGVTVTLVDMGTHRTRITKTTSMGEYIFSPLPVGEYSVTATKHGFRPQTTTNIEVHASVTSHADLVMKVGTMRQSVTVTAPQVSVNTTGSDEGMTLTKTDITQIPSNGRTWETSLSVIPINGTNEFEAGVGVLIDGADANVSMENGLGLQADRSNMVITRENMGAIAQIQVMQGNYSAEYGNSMGDVINLITKSGTNHFHGEAYEYYQNEAMDARNFFAAPGVSTPMTWNQFGGNLGGPFIKNKLFFFGNYEGIRQTYTASGLYHVLNLAQRQKFVPSMQPVVAAIPLGNGGPDPADPSVFDLYHANEVNQHGEDTGSVKLDWDASAKDVLSARYNDNNSRTYLFYGIAAGQHTQTPQNIQFLKVSETHTFSPTLINEAGFAWQHNFDYAYGGGGNFHTTGFSCTGCDFGALPGPALFSIYSKLPVYEALDTVTKISGRQLMKFGFDIRHQGQDERTDLQDFLHYTSLANFQQNNAWQLTSLQQPMMRYRNTNYAFFFNDDFRAKPNLTLDMGLRYTYATVVHELSNNIANFNILTQKLLPPSRHIYNPSYTDFGPRFGFAWVPFHGDKTVIHGGLGIFYDPPGNFSSSVVQNTVHNLSYNIHQPPLNCTPALVLSYPLPDPLPTCSPIPPFSVTEVDPNMKDMYEDHWSFGVQRQIVRNVVLDTSYVGSHTGNMGFDLTNGINYNPLNPYTGARPLGDTKYLDETLNGPFYSADFNSLAVKLNGHLNKLTFNVALTWQNEMDDTTGFFGAYQYPFDPAADWAAGARGVQFNSSVVYYFPAVPRVPRVLGNGWEVSGLEQHSPGYPFTITTGQQTIYSTSQRPNRVLGVPVRPSNYSVPFNQLNKAAFVAPPGTGAVGNLGRNSVIGPGATFFDMSVMKNTYLFRERDNLVLRCDFFNVLNHPTFGNPDGTMSDASFGQTLGTSGSARILQVSAQFNF